MQFPYQKVLVLGCGGAGKSTFAVSMGARFSLPVVHLDRLWWLPGWVERSREEFDGMLAAELAKPAWVMDGNYHPFAAPCGGGLRRLSRCSFAHLSGERIRAGGAICGKNAARYDAGLPGARGRGI